MRTVEINGSGSIESTASPNPGFLKEFVRWAKDCGVRPHLLITGQRFAHEPNQPRPNTLIDEVWVLRPPTEGSRYQKPQAGIACDTSGQIYQFDPETRGGNSIVLSRNCPVAGIDPAAFEEAWIVTTLDGAEANLIAAAAAKMNMTEYMTWAQNRQAVGTIAVGTA